MVVMRDSSTNALCTKWYRKSMSSVHYKQIFGTPMGNTISPILCNYVLDDLITDSLNKTYFNVPFIKRYVDDLLFLFLKTRWRY
nr:unnamed protein product [Callosobruchus analis]